MRNRNKFRLSTAVRIAAVSTTAIVCIQSALAQDQPQSAQAPQVEEVVVTGSRIRTTDTTTPAPVAIINAQSFQDLGFTDAAQAVNQMTANIPQFETAGTGATRSQNPGQQAPNLLNLGANRTLTLMNGQRMPSTASGLAGAQTDANIFPVGLLERVDIVPGGGASIYGSGAIGGVVNYVIKDHFQGLQVDAQGGISTYGDYPQWSVRATAGTDFHGGRGNVAADFEYSHTGYLNALDRPIPAWSPRGYPNPAYVAGSTTIPQQIYMPSQLQVYSATPGGIIYKTPTVASNLVPNLLTVGTSKVQFGPGGTLVNFNPGTIYPTSAGIATGGDGFPRAGYDGLANAVDRYIFNGFAHYDLDDHMKVSTELMYARTNAYAPNQQLWMTDYDPTLLGAIPFYSGNPYLPAATKTSLLAAFPGWASAGPNNGVATAATPFVGGTAPLWLGVAPTDLLPDYGTFTSTITYRGRAALDGDFAVGERNFYYEFSASHAEVDRNIVSWALVGQNLLNAVNATTNSAGTIVCASGAANCVPIDLFGGGGITTGARQYVTAMSGNVATGGGAVSPFVNKMDDIIASLGGDLVQLPAGEAKFNVAYERRIESSRVTPLPADQLGIVYLGSVTPPTSGQFHTGEYAGELLIPVLGKGMNLPFVQSLDVNASDRFVDHSIAGKENVWGAGAKLALDYGVTFRGSFARNFNSPTLTQLGAPRTTALSVVNDPCSPLNIKSGNNPAVRAANCLALFTTNAGYGLNTLPAGVANTPANRLASFNSLANNLSTARVTSGGNPDLVAETSHTETFGVILQPTFVPNLTISADRIVISMINQLSQFTPTTFQSNCFDSPAYPNTLCNTITRDASGQILTALSEPFNAGYVRIGVEIYNIDYHFALNSLFGGGSDLGDLNVVLQATHNTGNWSVTQLSVTEIDDTTASPEWIGSLTTNYSIGPWRFTGHVSYFPAEPPTRTSTIVNTVQGYTPVSANARVDLSAQYSISDNYVFRAGVTNLTNAGPNQLPLYAIAGDAIGRQFFFGVKAKFF